MELAHQARLASTKSDVRSHDLSIILGYFTFALVMVIAIYLAAGQSGTSPVDFANMTVFP